MKNNQIFIGASVIILIVFAGVFQASRAKLTKTSQAKDNPDTHASHMETEKNEPSEVVSLDVTFEIPKNDFGQSVIQEKFVKMRQDHNNNNDIVGYLKVGNTTIDYPVVQSSDNKYYLERDIDGRHDSAGSIYLDYENDVQRQDRNTVIYGHNMNRDYMFHSIRYFRDQAFFNENRFITFDTLYGNQTWEVFAFYKTDTKFKYIRVFFEDDDDFMNMVNEMKARSMYDTGVELTPNDRILTLSTCSNQETDTRLVVNARLVESSVYADIAPNMFYD